MKSNQNNFQEVILAVEIVYKQTVYSYTGNDKNAFLKITVALPKLIAPCKRLLEKEIIYDAFNHTYTPFETNIDFDIRYK